MAMIPEKFRSYVKELADYIGYHPCGSTVENLIAGVTQALIKSGMKQEKAEEFIDSVPVKEFVDEGKVVDIRKKLTEAAGRLRALGYVGQAENEAYALYRFDHNEQEARKQVDAWKRAAKQ